MNKNLVKGNVSIILRNFRLLYFSDWLRFYFQRFKNRKINRIFRINNPDVKLPPDYLIYESFQINYFKFYTESIDTAQWLTNLLKKHIDLNHLKILDWGCGPGRIIRHLPGLIGNGSQFFGTDYNKKSVEWCTRNLTGISFNNNSLNADLPYPDNFFNVIYGISIFTHLSKELHFKWYNELIRILKPGGILLLTTAGDNFKVKLTKNELKQYENDELVVRGRVMEGHRTFSAFHPERFIAKMLNGVDILEHIKTEPEEGKALPQDTWIVKKK